MNQEESEVPNNIEEEVFEYRPRDENISYRIEKPDPHMKKNCASCNRIIRDQCNQKYKERGNFCQECNNLAGEMAGIRKTKYYFAEKRCSNPKCWNGMTSSVDENGKVSHKQCKVCIFNEFTESDRIKMFNELFLKRNRPDLVDSPACKDMDFKNFKI